MHYHPMLLAQLHLDICLQTSSANIPEKNFHAGHRLRHSVLDGPKKLSDVD